MKKQTKGKRTPPRRKPVRMPKAQKTREGKFHYTFHMDDEMLAEQRIMHQSMPPEVLAEYLRLNEIPGISISPQDDARLNEIFDEYHRPVPREVLDHHIADIVREREQKAVQDQQDGTVT